MLAKKTRVIFHLFRSWWIKKKNGVEKIKEKNRSDTKAQRWWGVGEGLRGKKEEKVTKKIEIIECQKEK